MSKTLSFDDQNDCRNRADEIVTVKFRTDTNETLTQAFDLKTDVGSIRSYLHRSLNVDPNKIVIGREGSALSDGENLKELGATPLGIFELDVQGDGVRLPKPSYYLPVVDVITVRVKHKTLVVEIERCDPSTKPWLGGYRDRATGRVYRNACAQTDFRPKMYADAVQVDGRAQTCADKSVGHAGRGAWTQTADGTDGKTVTAGRYRSHQTWLERECVLASAVKIQRAFRKTVARNGRAADAGDAPRAPERREAVRTEPSVTTALESKQQHFCALYTTISKWWKRERQRIKEIEADNCRKTAQMDLLKNEIRFLLEMEKQRSELRYELTKHDDMTLLNKTSKPTMFKNRDGKLLTIDTVGNQRARALRAVYVDYITERGPCGDRIRALDQLSSLVSGSTYKYKRHLLDAVSLEKDLTTMRVDAASVRSAGARVEQMFRHFIRQPEVNPEAAAVGSSHGDERRRVLHVYACMRCKRNLAATDFSLESRVNRTNVCANCEWTEQVGHKRIDMAPYRRILKALRRDEMQRAAYDSECFLMQPAEVYRLVSLVWAERSAVGECCQLNGLRLVRWRADEPWSPWNCVLLSRAEAEAHVRLAGDPARCYDQRFVRRVVNRHVMARLQFSNLVRAVGQRKRRKPLSKHWNTVAGRFNIKRTT